MKYILVRDTEPKITTELLNVVPKNKHDLLRREFVSSPLTEGIAELLLREINSKILPLDDKSAGWEIREAFRQGELKALTKFLKLLP